MADAELQTNPGDIVLEKRFRLLPHAPLPELGSPTAKAYAAVDLGDPDRPFFCLICDPLVPPRRSLMQRFKGRVAPGFLSPIEDGVCDWPPLGGRALVAVFDRPGGARLEPGLCLPAADLVRRVLVPIAEVLVVLEKRGLPHRALRPDNLFWSGADQESVVLGECVTAPPGYSQPAAYETLENVTAHPAGRSPGSTRDDLYALGVLILALCRSPSFPPDVADDDLIVRKFDQGSLTTLIGDLPVPPELAPAVRALLCDAPDQRWTAEELLAWLRNDRVVAMRATAPQPAARLFELGDRGYATPASLAFGLAQSQDTAVAAIRGGHVEQWLRNAARAEKSADDIEALHGTAGRFDRPNSRTDAALVARACLILDPQGPFRFGKLAVMPEGLGTALYALFARGEPVDDLAGILEAQIPAWLPADRAKWLPGFQGWIDRMYVHLKDHGLGGGIERCLYEMNPDLPCLGDKVGRACVTDLESLLAALETSARNADLATSPIDSQIAAFALTHLGLRRSPLPADILQEGRKGDRAVFEVGLLAAVQQAAGKRPVPLLCKWLVHRITPRIEQLHNRRLRRRLTAEFAKRKEGGSLAGLLQIINNPQMWKEDVRGLAAARDAYRHNEEAIAALENGRTARLEAALGTGREAAVAVSLSVALALASVGLFLQSMG